MMLSLNCNGYLNVNNIIIIIRWGFSFKEKARFFLPPVPSRSFSVLHVCVASVIGAYCESGILIVLITITSIGSQ